MPSQRKRANAFDDFPTGEAAQPASQPPAQPAAPEPPATSGTRGMGHPATPTQVERIERLKPSQMLPDRFQPRRLLPAGLRAAFFGGRIDCYQAAGEWLALSKNDNSLRAEIERLLAMGESFDQHGQIKPMTGSWGALADGRYIFMIETGERRFWAACLRAVRDRLADEPLLRVEVVEHPTRQRQVLENRHAEPPSAVGQSCEVAGLILAELGIAPDPNVADEYDYFRQARAQRMPAGLWEKIMPIMQLTRPRMVQLLNILQLPTSLLELADRYRLAERVLREVLSLPREQWERTLRTAIQEQLTADQVADLGARPLQSSAPHANPIGGASLYPGRLAASGLRRFANAIVDLDEVSQAQALDEVADSLVSTNQAEGMLNLLGELSHLVQIRLDARRR
jgi:hypothetical protein